MRCETRLREFDADGCKHASARMPSARTACEGGANVWGSSGYGSSHGALCVQPPFKALVGFTFEGPRVIDSRGPSTL